MPHDNNNKKLKVGDEVIVRFKVKSLCEGEEFCNVTLETVAGRRPDDAKELWSAVNTAVTELVEDCTARMHGTFSEALNAAIAGKKIARTGWNGKGMWVAYAPGSEVADVNARSGSCKLLADEGHEIIKINGHLDMKLVDGSVLIGWQPTQVDMLASDWVVVE